MGNITVAIKKFFTNKNTVTVIGILLGIVVLYVGYNMRINSQVKPVPMPYAKERLSPKTKITDDMVGTINVPAAMVQGKPIADKGQVVGKYVNIDSVIPKGSLFYPTMVVPKEKLPDSILFDYPEGYVLVNFPVDMTMTYGNAIFPGNYIDIYLKAINRIDEDNITTDTKDKIMVGKLLQNVKVLSVVDANGDPVFADLENKKVPSLIIFAVPEEYHILIRKAMYLRTYDATLIPVPTNESLSPTPGEVTLSSEEIKNFINRITVWTEDTGK